ncbi:transglutaminase domain-containing protein [bacterium]|nr:transglutaminase domain-containing protein [bacterium]
MKKVILNFIAVGAVVWWVLMMVLLYQRTHHEVPTSQQDFNVVGLGNIQKEEWNTISMQDDKIGYSNKIIQTTAGFYLVNETTYLRLPVGGVMQEILLEGIYTVDSSFAISSFTFTFSSDDYEITTNGSVGEDGLHVTITSEDNEETLSFPISGSIFPPALIPEYLALRDFTPDHIEIPTFDPFTMAPVKYNIDISRQYPPSRFGTEGPVWHVYLYLGSLMSEMWIEENGTMIIEKSGQGLSSYKATKEEALAFTMNKHGKEDLLQDFAIRTNKEIENPRDITYLKIAIQGVETQLFEFQDFNQRFVDGNDVLEISSYGFDNDSMLGDPPDSDDLISDAFVQSQDQRILSRALKITEGISDTLEMLKVINSWLYENIDKDYTMSIPNAVDILNKKKGDCNEHSILFTALARSIGIHTRMNVGVLYMEGLFYYHMWNQAYANGKWHTFDATLNQYPADATHLKLLSGSLQEQIQLLRIEGFRIKILDYKYGNLTLINEN